MTNSQTPTLAFGKYADQPITEVPTHYLKWVRRTSDRPVPAVEDELVRRGQYEVQPLRPLPTYDAKKANRIFAEARNKQRVAKRAERKRKSKRKRAKRLQQARERWQQEQQAITQRVKAGFTIAGRDFDPSRCDGSCPF